MPFLVLRLQAAPAAGGGAGASVLSEYDLRGTYAWEGRAGRARRGALSEAVRFICLVLGTHIWWRDLWVVETRNRWHVPCEAQPNARKASAVRVLRGPSSAGGQPGDSRPDTALYVRAVTFYPFGVCRSADRATALLSLSLAKCSVPGFPDWIREGWAP